VEAPFVAIAFLFGLLIGSFLNVVAYRLPRGESLVSPPSHCPACGKPVRPRDNIPVLGWLLLHGRCRDCGEPFSWRYPAVELLTGVLYALVVATQDQTIDIVLGLCLVTALIPITLIDLDVRRIPDKITAPAAVTALVAGLALDIAGVPEQLIAGAAALLLFYLAAVMKPGGMGMGDVKLVGVLGLYLGRAVAPAIFIALILGVVVGGVIMARVGVATGRKRSVPFGPFLAIGGLIAFFVGDDIVNAYTDRF
jgi:leader peptidase (prepilin peptidase)/N-methyltransferase